jgi:hypothetical protein
MSGTNSWAMAGMSPIEPTAQPDVVLKWVSFDEMLKLMVDKPYWGCPTHIASRYGRFYVWPLPVRIVEQF